MRSFVSPRMWTSLWITGGKLWVVVRLLPTCIVRLRAAMWNSPLEHTSYASFAHKFIHTPVGSFTSVNFGLYTLYTGLKITPTSL